MADERILTNNCHGMDETMVEFNFKTENTTRSTSRESSVSYTLPDEVDPLVPKKRLKKQIRPKVQGEWSDQEVLTLIKSVEQRRTLWDKALPDYKLPKKSMWTEISEIIGRHSSDDCKAKWNNLRVTFNINISRYRSKKSVQATDENIKIIWRYFNDMLFLKSTSVLQSTNTSTHLNSATPDESVLDDLHFAGGASQAPPTTTPFCRRPKQNTPLLSTSSSPLPIQSHSEESFKILAAQALAAITTKDEYATFGEYIASELRCLGGRRAAFVKRKLQRAFIEFVEAADSMVMSNETYIRPEAYF